MACFERSSPALKEILLKLYRAQKPTEIDHHLYEFGSVKYHIQSSKVDPQNTYLSIWTPLLSQGVVLPNGLSHFTKEIVKNICCDVAEIVEPAKQGYHLTLSLDFSKIPNTKESENLIAKMSKLQAVILSSQLKEMLKNIQTEDRYEGAYKPIKLVYHPREPFFVIKMPHKIIAVFPMRFSEESDVVIATSFFQELMEIGNLDKWARAPLCSWSAIPPPELRGEPFRDLSTNAGFVSFEISPRHVEGKLLDKIVWNLLNFHAFVKHHVKSTKGFVQRSMRKCLDSLAHVLQSSKVEEKEVMTIRRPHTKGNTLRQGYGEIGMRMKRLRLRTKIYGLRRLQCRCLKRTSFSSSTRYTGL